MFKNIILLVSLLAALTSSLSVPLFARHDDGDFIKQNELDAQNLNALFATIDSQSPCHDGDSACIGVAFAQCKGGKWQLDQPPSGESCFAVPNPTKPGTSLVYGPKNEASERIADTGATGGIAGPTTNLTSASGGDNDSPGSSDDEDDCEDENNDDNGGGGDGGGDDTGDCEDGEGDDVAGDNTSTDVPKSVDADGDDDCDDAEGDAPPAASATSPTASKPKSSSLASTRSGQPTATSAASNGGYRRQIPSQSANDATTSSRAPSSTSSTSLDIFSTLVSNYTPPSINLSTTPTASGEATVTVTLLSTVFVTATGGVLPPTSVPSPQNGQAGPSSDPFTSINLTPAPVNTPAPSTYALSENLTKELSA